MKVNTNPSLLDDFLRWFTPKYLKWSQVYHASIVDFVYARALRNMNHEAIKEETAVFTQAKRKEFIDSCRSEYIDHLLDRYNLKEIDLETLKSHARVIQDMSFDETASEDGLLFFIDK